MAVGTGVEVLAWATEVGAGERAGVTTGLAGISGVAGLAAGCPFMGLEC